MEYDRVRQAIALLATDDDDDDDSDNDATATADDGDDDTTQLIRPTNVCDDDDAMR